MVYRLCSGPGAVILEICRLNFWWIVDCSLNHMLTKGTDVVEYIQQEEWHGVLTLAGLIKPDLMRNKTPRRSSWNNGCLLSKRLCPMYDGVWLVSQQNFHEAPWA